MKTIVLWLLIPVLIVGALGIALLVGKNSGAFSSPLLSPLSTLVSSQARRELPKSDKVIFGFLPYWNLKYESSLRYSQLTDIAFFGLEVQKDGSFLSFIDRYHEEPGWTAIRSPAFGTVVRKAHAANVNVHLVLRSFDNDTIEALLSSVRAQETLIRETMDLIELKHFDGVNIDFEYVGSPSQEVRERFVAFVKKMGSACHATPTTCRLSVDAYADAATTDRLWDLSSLGKETDFTIVMAYDFTRPTSEYSGPVAPLHLVKEAIAAYTDFVPPEKLLLGVPYYGYEWLTFSGEPRSKTRKNGFLATYRRVKETILGTSIERGWDEEGFSPYIISTESGTTRQIFYDDERSLGLKYDFVNETGLGGVAIWALGYDAPRQELWNLLSEKFSTSVAH